MKYKILYIKNYPDEYNKISAIVPIDHEFSENEKDNSLFGIIEMELDDDKKLEIQNNNKYCIGKNDENLLIAVDEKYVIKEGE